MFLVCVEVGVSSLKSMASLDGAVSFEPSCFALSFSLRRVSSSECRNISICASVKVLFTPSG